MTLRSELQPADRSKAASRSDTPQGLRSPQNLSVAAVDLPMPIESIRMGDSIRRSTCNLEDVWFLSGPTQMGEGILHTAVDGNPFVIGRKNGVSLKLQFRTVSGNHACLWTEKGQLLMRDLGSTNGTYLNGKRIASHEIVPVVEEDLVNFAEAAFRIRRQSPVGMSQGTVAESVCDKALALVQFDRLMSEKLVRPHYQAIIRLDDRAIIGYEVLGRGSVFGLESVTSMFHAAEQLNLQVELSQLLRWEGIRQGGEPLDFPTLFVNTHPAELDDVDTLIKSLTAIREMSVRSPLVLEIHEAAVAETHRLKTLIRELDNLNIEFAFDDFGSGQARLAELIETRPKYVKFDISLIQRIDQADASRRRTIETLVRMVSDLDINPLAEGVESSEEDRVCREIGFQSGQGFYYGRPSPV